MEAADFFVSTANSDAFRMVRHPARWPQGKLLLVGPSGSGKSHLARVFAATHGAAIIQAQDAADRFPDTATVVESVDTLPAALEPALFHLHNHMVAHGLPLLMTARSLPATWNIGLPDLNSRMQATTPVRIAPPDDALLEALLMKLFADRQILPPPSLPRYLASRIDRSYLAAQQIVAALDAVALGSGKSVSTRMAARLLEKDDPDAE
nr:chromosomal replication initiator DnaA [Loktanella sp. SALINAS62]